MVSVVMATCNGSSLLTIMFLQAVVEPPPAYKPPVLLLSLRVAFVQEEYNVSNCIYFFAAPYVSP